MTNSPLVSYTLISPNKSSPRNKPIDRISIHCVVGQCSVETLGAIFYPSTRQASSNYGIGKDGSVGMYVEEKDRSWCTSSSANDNRAVTIECASDTTSPYAVNDKVFATLLDLCEDICRRNGKTKLLWFGDKDKTLAYTPAANEMVLTVHRWFANKSCPGDYLYNRHAKIAATVTARLNTPAQPEVDEELEQFKKLFGKMRKELQDNDSSKWSAEARKWAVESGIVQGSSSKEFNGMWEDLLTREQMVTMLYRFAIKYGLEKEVNSNEAGE